jgi:hypothetical protein
MADPLKERISLLQMGEAQGKLKPEHQAELNEYRQRGLARGRLPQAPPTSPGAPVTTSGGELETASARDKARSALVTIERLQPALDRVRKLQKATLGRSGMAAIGEFNPFDADNQEYDAAVAILRALTRPATRTTGEGSMSDFDAKMATAILPDRWQRDKYNNEAIGGLQRLVDNTKSLYAGQLGLPAPPPRLRKAPTGRTGGLPPGWKITRK